MIANSREPSAISTLAFSLFYDIKLFQKSFRFWVVTSEISV